MTYAVAILLALSTAGNAWQFHRHEATLEAKAATEQLAKDTTEAAKACTRGVDDLARAGRIRGQALLQAMRGAAPKVAALEAAASVAARAKPDAPSDLCGSLERYWKAQIKAERAEK